MCVMISEIFWMKYGTLSLYSKKDKKYIILNKYLKIGDIINITIRYLLRTSLEQKIKKIQN